MRWLKIADGKSGSREVALSALIFWAFITGWLLWWRSSTEINDYRWIYEKITDAVWLFAGGAFIGNMVANRFPPRPPAPTPYPYPASPARRDDPD